MHDYLEQMDLILADGLLNVSQAATFLGLSRATLYNLMDSGQIIYAKFGKARRIPKNAIIEYAKRHLIGGQGRAHGKGA